MTTRVQLDTGRADSAGPLFRFVTKWQHSIAIAARVHGCIALSRPACLEATLTPAVAGLLGILAVARRSHPRSRSRLEASHMMSVTPIKWHG
jgi:hypothetical protein